MRKKRTLLISILIIKQVYAMDVPRELKKTDSTIEKDVYIKEFLLRITALPTDIKRYIFQILPLHDLETHDEFITRVKTTIKNDLPNKYYYKNLQEPPLRQGYVDRSSIPTGLCPYNTHVAVLNKNHLQIINIGNHSILHTEEFFPPIYPKEQYYDHVALSGDTHTIATIHQEYQLLPSTFDDQLHFTSIDMITIKNRIIKKTALIKIPINFQIAGTHYRFPEFAFKKEGTHLILRGIHGEQEQICSCDPESPCDIICQDMPHYLIIPVTINELKASDEHNTPLTKYHLFSLVKKIMDGVLPNSARQESKKKK